MNRRLFGNALQIGLLALAGFVMEVAQAAPELKQAPRGNLIIVGGGDTPTAVQERFVALAGGSGKARIAVFPMASTESDEEAGEVMADFKLLGAEVQVFHFDRSKAAEKSLSKSLQGFSGYWFTGGDQTRLANTLLGTRALATLERRYREGAVIGGTSAGAAVMSLAMLTGNRNAPEGVDDADSLPIAHGTFEISQGFGFLPGVIVDQHFLQRARYNRLLSAVLDQPQLIGLGIDEGTAVLVRPDGRWEVLGASYVKIFDARWADVTTGSNPRAGASGIRMHLLSAHGVFDPKTGMAMLHID